MATKLKRIEFWYEFASPYSYLAAMRVEDVAMDHGVLVEWKPFLLGPIFKQQGLNDSPFNVFQAKGAYMWRDVERVCDQLDLSFQKPTNFPQNGLLAARLAICDEVANKQSQFSQAVFLAQFSLGQDISSLITLQAILENLEVDREKAVAQSQSDEVKLALRNQTEQAAERGIFGAPMFITSDGEMFWGNDRLEQAVAWTVARAAGSGHKS